MTCAETYKGRTQKRAVALSKSCATPHFCATTHLEAMGKHQPECLDRVKLGGANQQNHFHCIIEASRRALRPPQWPKAAGIRELGQSRQRPAPHPTGEGVGPCRKRHRRSRDQ